ncbi:MAG: NAD(P)/FAD-dependent oxidoreductase [bacterium]|nr:NAD(P)/FAD-dependent oxidoreductase [bacterium]
MESYDIIIIGAGPAGLNAAKILGDAERKVLLLEKNAEIGPKVCAGGLTRKSIRYLNLPQEIIDYKYNEIIFNSPHFRSSIKFSDIFFYTVDRKNLGQWQLEKINRDFVEVRTNTHVVQIEKDFIITKENQKIGFNYLIGADGSNSIVRRHLKLKTRLAGVAIQYKIPLGTFKDFEIFMHSKFFGAWYSWIFPHKDHISIGYGYPQKLFSPIKAQKKFEHWAQSKNIDLKNSIREAFLINCDYRGFRFGNIFLSGDAAGIADSFTGEGIYQALVSGEDIAKIILDKNHRPKKIRAVIREKRIHEIMLLLIICSWFFRDLVFDGITFLVRIKLFGKTLIRILS